MTMTCPTANNFLTRAGILLERGIHVVPVDPGQKRCTLTSWPELRTLDLTVVQHWNQINYNFNTAAVADPNTVCVLDCDAHGLIARIERETGRKIPSTFAVRSGGKGCPHLYFKQTDATRALGNRSAKELFDLKVSRSYVVGPGSVLENGGEYTVTNDAPIVEMPAWLADWIEHNSASQKPAGYDRMPDLDENFDFEAFIDWYGITGDQGGDWFITDVCPVAGRKHEQSDRTGLFYDGRRLGFKCFAASCPGSEMSIGKLIAHLNAPGNGRIHAPYHGVIWPKKDEAAAAAAPTPAPAPTGEVIEPAKIEQVYTKIGPLVVRGMDYADMLADIITIGTPIPRGFARETLKLTLLSLLEEDWPRPAWYKQLHTRQYLIMLSDTSNSKAGKSCRPSSTSTATAWVARSSRSFALGA
jgi:hypothetical protein